MIEHTHENIQSGSQPSPASQLDPSVYMANVPHIAERRQLIELIAKQDAVNAEMNQLPAASEYAAISDDYAARMKPLHDQIDRLNDEKHTKLGEVRERRAAEREEYEARLEAIDEEITAVGQSLWGDGTEVCALTGLVLLESDDVLSDDNGTYVIRAALLGQRIDKTETDDEDCDDTEMPDAAE